MAVLCRRMTVGNSRKSMIHVWTDPATREGVESSWFQKKFKRKVTNLKFIMGHKTCLTSILTMAFAILQRKAYFGRSMYKYSFVSLSLLFCLRDTLYFHFSPLSFISPKKTISNAYLVPCIRCGEHTWYMSAPSVQRMPSWVGCWSAGG